MDLSFTPEQQRVPRGGAQLDRAAMPPEMKRKAEAGASFQQDETMEWHRILYAKGWIAPHWPKEVGGTGWDVAQRFIFQEELVRANAPAALALRPRRWSGPLLIQFGNDEQKQRFLPKILVGRRSLVSGLLGAERRLRSREPPAARREGRRRLRPERPEDLDDLRAVRRLDLRARAHRRRRQEAGGHLLPAGRRQEHARHHGEALPHHRRHRRLLRDLVQERARAAERTASAPRTAAGRWRRRCSATSAR